MNERRNLLAPLTKGLASHAFVEQLFKTWTFFLASGIEAAAAIVIGVASLEGIVRALILFARRHLAEQELKEQIRLRLGRWLAVALEFELAADILRTAIAPTWNEIGQLAAIVVLRTVLNFFLQKEIDKASQRTRPAMVDEHLRAA